MLEYQLAYLPKRENISCDQISRKVGLNTNKIHMHNFEELMLITSSGAFRTVSNGTSLTIPTPALIMNKAGSFHAIVEIFDNKLSAFVSFFHPQVYSLVPSEPSYKEALYQGNDLLAIPLTQQQAEDFIPLFTLLQHRPLSQKRFLLLCILDHMVQLLAEGVSPIRTCSKQTYIFEVAALLQNMEGSKGLTLAQLAERFHVSQTKLKTDFKRITDMPIHMFRRHAQLQEACILLESTQMELAQIAYACGFNDESYFIRVFRQEYGITPGAYRKEVKNT